jgi:hypothetical protein
VVAMVEILLLFQLFLVAADLLLRGVLAVFLD